MQRLVLRLERVGSVCGGMVNCYGIGTVPPESEQSGPAILSPEQSRACLSAIKTIKPTIWIEIFTYHQPGIAGAVCMSGSGNPKMVI